MNSDQFTSIVEKTHHIVLAAVRKYLFIEHHSRIDDAVQETYIRAYKSLVTGQLIDATKLNSWLYVIAKNESIRINKKFLRDRDIEKKYSEFLEAEENSTEKLKNDLMLFDEIKNYAEYIPVKYKKTFDLFLEGQNESAIAEKLKIPKGTVKSRLHRAKAIICKILRD